MSPLTFGLDVGGTKLLGLALDEDGTIVAEERAPTPASRGPDAIEHERHSLLEAMASIVEELAGRLGSRDAPTSPRLGVGVPGLVDDSGTLRFAPNLPVGTGLDVAGLLAKRLPGWLIAVDNDSTCGALGEWLHGAAKEATDAVMVALGTGIGGGIVSGGRLVRGTNGFAGEIGHMVVDPTGPACPCGRRGCWERYASGSGLGRLAREAADAGRLGEVVRLANGDPEAVRGEHVTLAATAGDEEALAVVQELGRWLAIGLANLANILDTATFVIGGGLVGTVALVLDSVRATFDEMVEGGDQRPEVEIALATLGERAGAIGAALMARERAT